MTLNQVLNLDCRKSGSNEIIQRQLRKVKPLSKYVDEDVPFEKIEKLIVVLSKKYNMRVREFVPDIWSNVKEIIWRAEVIDDRSLKQIGLVYGLSLYELLSKVAIGMYYMKDKVGERK